MCYEFFTLYNIKYLISTISSVKNINKYTFIQFHFVVLGCELITTQHNNVNQDKAVITEVKMFFLFPSHSSYNNNISGNKNVLEILKKNIFLTYHVFDKKFALYQNY